MNLNDRIALILGRAIIRAEEMSIRAEQAEAALAEQDGHPPIPDTRRETDASAKR